MFLMISLPLLLAGALFPRRLRPLAVRLAPWAALPALGLALWSPPPLAVEWPWLFLGMRLGLDEVGRMLMIGTAGLWTLVGISARASLAQDPRQHRFFIAYLITMTGNLGLFIGQDLATFTLCYALMTFAAYGLIIYEDNPTAHRAGRIYLMLAVIGDALLLEAVFLITSAAGNQDMAGVPGAIVAASTRNLIMTLLLAGFGIKIGVLPFHVWMPLAYSSAPLGASAVLSGSMVLAGLLGLVRLFPLGEMSLPGWGLFCIIVGTVALLYSLGVGLTQNNPRTILAYSSIHQVGLITVGLGIGMLMPETWPLIFGTLMLDALHLALVMGILFLGLDVARKTSGLVWQHRLIWLGLLVAALSLAGAPLTSGAVAKAMFQSAVSMTPWVEQFSWLLVLTAVGTTLLLGRFLVEAWPQIQVEGPQDCAGLTTGIWLPWAMLILSEAMFVWVVPWNPSFESLTLIWSPAVVWGSFWPILLGGLLVWSLKRKPAMFAALPIPPGDLVVWAEWLEHRTQERCHVLKGMALQAWSSDLVSHWFSPKSGLWVSSVIQEMEEWLGQWMVLGAAFLFLAVLFLTFIIISA